VLSVSRENGSAIYNCCWSSPAQSFLGVSPAGLVTVYNCHRFETPPTWRSRSPNFYPPGTGWPSYTPRHWVLFSSPPTTRRAAVELFEAASPRTKPFEKLYSLRADAQKTQFLCWLPSTVEKTSYVVPIVESGISRRGQVT
jgi:hypothetical protein